MLTKILIIVFGVTVFGILFFFYVKHLLKKKLNLYTSKKAKK